MRPWEFAAADDEIDRLGFVRIPKEAGSARRSRGLGSFGPGTRVRATFEPPGFDRAPMQPDSFEFE